MISRLFFRLAPFSLGLALLTIPFYRVLFFTDRTLLFRDLARDLLPQKFIWWQSVSTGHGIPFWNHFAFGGVSFYSMIVGSPLNPLNLIFLPFPAEEIPKALSYYLWAHYLLFYGGAYLLLRVRRHSGLEAAFFGSGFTLSGFMLSIHSLGHLLAASVAVPWFFYCANRFFHSEKRIWLFPLSLALAWPIYGGDPQFSYLLTLFALYFFLRARLYRELLFLGALAFLAASAQLLPFAHDVLRSQRLNMSSEELLLFSFHPLRIAEFFFPLFFGNRYGQETYWGEAFVNFYYKNPFIFSVYPGILALFGAFLAPVLLRRAWQRGRRKELALAGAIGGGLVISMGAFFPLPVYKWVSTALPLFGLFRYPERILFWPLFGYFLLVARWWRLALRAPNLFQSASYRTGLGLFLAGSGILYFAVGAKWLDLPESAAHSVLRSAPPIAALYAAIFLIRSLRARRSWAYGLIGLAMALDLAFNQTQLIWDQNKYIADGKRYPLVRLLQNDLNARGEEIKHGASFRLGSAELNRLLFMNRLMDHSTQTSFSAFENLAPNTPGMFGIEDIAGYFSFQPAEHATFWKWVVRQGPTGEYDLRFYFDLMGAHYIPQRDQTQQVVLKRNGSAQPYLFVPERVFLREAGEAALSTFQDANFRTNHDALIMSEGFSAPVPESAYLPQQEERGNFLIQKRDGRSIEFIYSPATAAGTRYLVLNEGFDESWNAYVNGRRAPVQKANGWSMAIPIDPAGSREPIKVAFRYESPYIRAGAWLSGVWIALLLTGIGVTIRSRFAYPIRTGISTVKTAP